MQVPNTGQEVKESLASRVNVKPADDRTGESSPEMLNIIRGASGVYTTAFPWTISPSAPSTVTDPKRVKSFGLISIASGEASSASPALTKDNTRQRTDSPAPVAGKPKKKLDVNALFAKAQPRSTPTPASVPSGHMPHQVNMPPHMWGYYYPQPHYDPNAQSYYWQPHMSPPHMASSPHNPQQTPPAMQLSNLPTPSQPPMAMPMSPRVPPIGVLQVAPQTPQPPHPSLPAGNRSSFIPKRPVLIKNSTGEMIDLADLSRKPQQEDAPAAPAVKKEETEHSPASIRLETVDAHKKRIEEEKLRDKDRFKKDEELAKLKAKRAAVAKERAKRDQEISDLANFSKKVPPKQGDASGVHSVKKEQTERRRISIRLETTGASASGLTAPDAVKSDIELEPASTADIAIHHEKLKKKKKKEKSEDVGPANDDEVHVVDHSERGVFSATTNSSAARTSLGMAKKQIQEYVKELFLLRHLGRAEEYFSAIPPKFRWYLVEELVHLAVDANGLDLDLISEVFVAVAAKSLIDENQFSRGFTTQMECLEDTSEYSPNAYNAVARLLRSSKLSQAAVERLTDNMEAVVITPKEKLLKKYALFPGS